MELGEERLPPITVSERDRVCIGTLYIPQFSDDYDPTNDCVDPKKWSTGELPVQNDVLRYAQICGVEMYHQYIRKDRLVIQAFAYVFQLSWLQEELFDESGFYFQVPADLELNSMYPYYNFQSILQPMDGGYDTYFGNDQKWYYRVVRLPASSNWKPAVRVILRCADRTIATVTIWVRRLP